LIFTDHFNDESLKRDDFDPRICVFVTLRGVAVYNYMCTIGCTNRRNGEKRCDTCYVTRNARVDFRDGRTRESINHFEGSRHRAEIANEKRETIAYRATDNVASAPARFFARERGGEGGREETLFQRCRSFQLSSNDPQVCTMYAKFRTW